MNCASILTNKREACYEKQKKAHGNVVGSTGFTGNFYFLFVAVCYMCEIFLHLWCRPVSYTHLTLPKKGLAGSRFFRYILLLPLVLPIASVVMVIQVFFSETGIINHWLLSIGVPIVQWLEGPNAFYVLLGLYIWKSFGYSVILLLSGLNTIPEEFYQTAEVEGAGSVQKLISITLPMMTPHFFLAAVMGIVNAFKSYREAFLLGGKHPHDSIYMIQHFLNNNFENLNYQKLSVAAILLFLVLFFLLCGLYLLQNRYREE